MTENEEISHLASLFFSRKEIEIIIHGSDDIILAARLQSEAELRASIFSLAKNGSGPAQNQAMKLIEDMRIKDMEDYDNN